MMSLTDPSIIEKLKPYKFAIVGVALLLLIGLVAFTFDRCDSYRTKRSDEKKKEEIANTVANIANISNTIANLELQKATEQGKLERDMEDLQNNIFGLEEAKKETNQALANFQVAVNTNSNVNRSAADLEEVLRRLER